MKPCSTVDLAEELVDLLHHHVATDEVHVPGEVWSNSPFGASFRVETRDGKRFLVTVSRDYL